MPPGEPGPQASTSLRNPPVFSSGTPSRPFIPLSLWSRYWLEASAYMPSPSSGTHGTGWTSASLSWRKYHARPLHRAAPCQASRRDKCTAPCPALPASPLQSACLSAQGHGRRKAGWRPQLILVRRDGCTVAQAGRGDEVHHLTCRSPAALCLGHAVEIQVEHLRPFHQGKPALQPEVPGPLRTVPWIPR